MTAGDGKLEAAVAALTVKASGPIAPLPKARIKGRQVNAPPCDVRAARHGVLGLDLTQIHGIGPSLALKLVAECGTDLTAWPATSSHLHQIRKPSLGKTARLRRHWFKHNRECDALPVDRQRHAKHNPKSTVSEIRIRGRASQTVLRPRDMPMSAYSAKWHQTATGPSNG